MFVYPWKAIRSSAEGLAIARAVQDKYGPAKEVVFPRDSDSITVFYPYFWLVFDNPEVRKRLPEDSAQIRVRVTDLPTSDGNVGIEEMMRGLGLSTDGDTPREPQPSTETEESGDVGKADDGYSTIDVRVEWARSGPNEVLLRRRSPMASFSDKEMIPDFAEAWLDFDGFSPESARGAHTPNLLRAREKWRSLAPSDIKPTIGAVSRLDSVEEGVGIEPLIAVKPEAEVNANVAPHPHPHPHPHSPPREWVPIIPSSPLTQPSASAPQNSKATVAADDLTGHVDTNPAIPASTPTPTSASMSATRPESVEVPESPKMSRRERILHLARQNARTPLPEPEGEPQAPNEVEKLEEDAEREGKERTIRERLWRLVGGNY
ncbi:hypothetical protein B0F90DRAFT_1816565 [Multifurca ochricompacta]|uniref:Uncharacterized protein n=1 Tax=Multifurca ochricompacta TaxID=376703 RepID=A0AAD4M7F7_9AGAM|nr:hypothetical protein B0F90DRAFT_1816565 [Multifurca ochricompacta]